MGVFMRQCLWCCFLLLCFHFLSDAETHITGDLTGMTFQSGGNPYIVEQDILIPAGSKAIIKEGCIFLFKPFTGLTIHGHLVVEGTQNQPVIFSSINDGEYNLKSEQLPNPFDWNGILVSRESGTVSLKNFALRFSVYGIKSQNTNIVIENGLFRQNGQFHFTINDKIQFVQDNIPFSYNGMQTNEIQTTPSPSNVKPATPGITIEKKASITRKIVRYTCLCIGIISSATTIYTGIELGKIHNDLQWASDNNLPVEYKTYHNRYLLMKNYTIAGGVITTLGFTGFGLTFVY